MRGHRRVLGCVGMLLCLLALLSLNARLVQAADYEEVAWFSRHILAGQIGTLGQGVRIPSKLFAESPCQLVYLPSPDWATSKAYVDFGSASPAAGCKQQAFLVYVDGYNEPRQITGIGSNADIPWAGFATAPANILAVTYAPGESSPSPSPSPSPDSSASPSPSGSAVPPPLITVPSPPPRQWWSTDIDIPLDRERFSSKYDNVRDDGAALQYLLESKEAAEEVVPGVGKPLSRPILASGYFQNGGGIPSDLQPYLDYVQRQRRLQEQQQAANGTAINSTTASVDEDGVEEEEEEIAIAGILEGPLPVFTVLPQECLDVLRLRRKEATVVSGSSTSSTYDSSGRGNPILNYIRRRTANSNVSSSDDAWEPLEGGAVDSCFVTQLAVLIYNDCPAAAFAAAPRVSDPSNPTAPECDGAASPEAGVACLLEQQLLQLSVNMSYIPNDADVRVVVMYKPYNGCYRPFAQNLGQAGIQVIIFTGGLIALVALILLMPTFIRLFISFPLRCILYGIRKLARRGKVLSDLPLDTGLHSYKAPVHHRCFELPIVRHVLGARKHVLYAMCTVHSADGQYRALQVAVTSSVAIMICMMSFPPNIIPPLEYFIPPLNFKINRTSDPLSSVWYFLTILAYSLYLGFIGYLAMLTNYNRPRNRYYLTQSILSVFFMLVLDALVVMQVVSILVYWDRLHPQWPWLPIITFQLANLAVANVLLLATLFAREDRRAARRRAQYEQLMQELRHREAHLASVRAAQRKERESAAAAAAALVVAEPNSASEEAPAGSAGGSGSGNGSGSGFAGGGAGGSLRHRATLTPAQQRRGQPPPPPPPGRGSAEFDNLAAMGSGTDVAKALLPPRGGPVAEGWEEVRAHKRPSAALVPAAGAVAMPESLEAAAAESSGPEVDAALPSKVSTLGSLRRRWAERQSAGLLPATWRKWSRPLSEDAAFRYPAWLLAALLVSAYMLIFTYARAMSWAEVIQDCIADPAECVNNNVARYLVFATRLLGRDWQVTVRDRLNALVASQTHLAHLITGAFDGNGTLSDLGSSLTAAAANLTDEVRAAASSQLGTALAAEVPALINASLGPELAALVPPSQTAALQSALTALVDARLAQLNATPLSEPLTRMVQNALLQSINLTTGPLMTAVTATANVLTVSIQVSNQLENWKEDLESRFFWCSLAGFTLGLLLGLSSLVRTAISFRTSARKLRLARIANRVLASAYDTDMADGGGGGKWAVSKLKNVYDEEDSIVRRSEATNITLVVFFFGVLLSTAIVQLYVVGVVLSVGLALATHPWTWTWLLPRYYMWLVAILIGVVLQKAILVSFVGDTWLSNGDRIFRPAAWLAFLVIASATNLVIGLLLAVYRIVLLLLTTIFALGKLDVTIFTMLAKLDLPHSTFLAGLHLQESMSNFHDPIYLPGPRGRAYRRWRKLRDALSTCGSDKLRELLSAPISEGRVGGSRLLSAVGSRGSSQVPPALPPSDSDQVMVVLPLPAPGTLAEAASLPPPPTSLQVNPAYALQSPQARAPEGATQTPHPQRRRMPPS